MDTERALAVDNMPGMASPIAPWLQPVGEFRRAVTLPVFHAARISDIATARHAIRDGLLDMVAMTRAHIADPHIVRKIEAGQEDRIRPCVGATHCQSQYRPSCLHNPATGRETTLATRVEPPSGPAARSSWWAAVRPGSRPRASAPSGGTHVVLFEAADRLGGQVLLGARASWRRDLLGIVDWRRAELERLGVEVRLNACAGAADVLAERPRRRDHRDGRRAAISTGSRGRSIVPASGTRSTGQVALGAEVIVYDGTGRHPAPQIAELAAAEGRQVSFVSIDAPTRPGADLCGAGGLEEAHLRARRADDLRPRASPASNAAATGSSRRSATSSRGRWWSVPPTRSSSSMARMPADGSIASCAAAGQ